MRKENLLFFHKPTSSYAFRKENTLVHEAPKTEYVLSQKCGMGEWIEKIKVWEEDGLKVLKESKRRGHVALTSLVAAYSHFSSLFVSLYILCQKGNPQPWHVRFCSCFRPNSAFVTPTTLGFDYLI